MFEEGVEPDEFPLPPCKGLGTCVCDGRCFCEHGMPSDLACGFCERGLVAVVVSGDDFVPEW